jgi:hypothetical protein
MLPYGVHVLPIWRDAVKKNNFMKFAKPPLTRSYELRSSDESSDADDESALALLAVDAPDRRESDAGERLVE